MLSYFNMVVPKLFDLTLVGGSMGGGGAGTGGRARPRGWVVGELLAAVLRYLYNIFLKR